MPIEIQLNILKYVNGNDILNISLVNRQFHELMTTSDGMSLRHHLLENEREAQQIELATELKWAPTARLIHNRLNENKYGNSSIRPDFWRIPSQIPLHMPFAQRDHFLDLNALAKLNCHEISKVNNLIIHLDKMSSHSDAELETLLTQLKPTSLCIKGKDIRQLERLLPHLIKITPQLVSIDVSYTWVNLHQFTLLIKEAANLKNLFISGLDIQCIAIAAQHCPQLEILIGNSLVELCYQVTPSPILQAELSFPSLRILDLGFTKSWTPRDYNFIQNCPRLERLGVCASGIRLNLLQAILKCCPKLNTLDIAGIEDIENTSNNFSGLVTALSQTTLSTLCSTIPLSDDQINQLFSSCPSLYFKRIMKSKWTFDGQFPTFDSLYSRTEEGIIKKEESFSMPPSLNVPKPSPVKMLNGERLHKIKMGG